MDKFYRAINTGDTREVRQILDSTTIKKEILTGVLHHVFKVDLSKHPNGRNIIPLLLDYGADINSKDHDNNNTVLIKAMDNRDIDIDLVKYFLSRGADPNIRGQNGLLPLKLATDSNELNLVKRLLRYGANVNDKDKYGYTSLMTACARGFLPVVKLLLQNGADLGIKNCWRETALDIAKLGQRTEIVKYLEKVILSIILLHAKEKGINPLMQSDVIRKMMEKYL